MVQSTSLVLLVSGVLIIAVGTTIYSVLLYIAYDNVNDMLLLLNGELVYDQWQKPTGAAYLQAWLFNVTNPERVMTGAKPDLRQVGPYTYRVERIKEQIKFRPKYFVEYIEKRKFHFDRSKSVGNDLDLVTTVNVPLVWVGKLVKDAHRMPTKWYINQLKTAIGDSDIFYQKSVRDILWGYHDPILEWHSQSFPGKWIDPRDGLFGVFNRTNNFWFLVDSGLYNLKNFTTIRREYGQTSIPMWEYREPNMVNGTDGLMFAPFLTTSSTLHIADLLMPAFSTTFVRKSFANGMEAYDFELPDRLWADHPDLAHNGHGVLNTSKEMQLLFSSLPHFYKAAQKYVDGVNGLSPSADFQLRLQVEPWTGQSLNFQKKWQLNFAIEPDADIKTTDFISRVVLPVVWFNDSASIDEKFADEIRTRIVLLYNVGFWLLIALIILSSILIVVAAVLAILLRKSNRSRLPVHSAAAGRQ